MQSDSYEKAFDNFIDGKEYDQAEQAIFRLVRAAFEAGWRAAINVMDEKNEEASPLQNLVDFPRP